MFFRDKGISGPFDAIRCDQRDYLIWKWQPSGNSHSRRANAIRWGSSLRVRDGEAAIFVVHGKDGNHQDCITGPYDGFLKSENLPVLSSIIGLAYGGGSPFQAEVYFVNLAQNTQVRFGVPFFDVFDPRFPDFGVPVAVRGTITFYIRDIRQFILLNQVQDFTIEDFQKQIRDVVCRYVKDIVANTPAAHNIPVVQMESKIAQINDEVEYSLKSRLEEDFGVAVSGVDIGVIEIDKGSSGYAQLMSITKKTTAETVQAQTAVNIQQMRDKQRIEAENYAETLRIQREEAQYAQRKQTQTSHFAAYQTEAQMQVGIAGAEALGKMGASGVGDASLGGMAFNPAAVVAGMTIGGVVGQNIAGTLNGIMSGPQVAPGTIPPPIPNVSYHVAVNGQAMGPYDFATLKTMAASGQLTPESLVWKSGMAQWEKVGTVEELRGLFSDLVPQIPPM